MTGNTGTNLCSCGAVPTRAVLCSLGFTIQSRGSATKACERCADRLAFRLLDLGAKEVVTLPLTELSAFESRQRASASAGRSES